MLAGFRLIPLTFTASIIRSVKSDIAPGSDTDIRARFISFALPDGKHRVPAPGIALRCGHLSIGIARQIFTPAVDSCAWCIPWDNQVLQFHTGTQIQLFPVIRSLVICTEVVRNLPNGLPQFLDRKPI